MVKQFRDVALISAAFALALPGAVSAQECDTDRDCPIGKLCVWSGGDVAVSDPACEGPDCPVSSDDPAPEPVKGSCETLPDGYCTVQSDCAEGLACVIPTVGSDCAEAPPRETESGGAIAKQSDCVSTSEPAPYGYCVLPEMPCTSDEQCLAGLTCVTDEETGSGSGSSEGGVSVDPGPAPDPKPTEKQAASGSCEVVLVDCDTNSDCSGGYVCTVVSSGEACSGGGSGGSASGATEGGAEPTEAVTKQVDEQCETFTEKVCFPPQRPCNSDAECGAESRCFEFTPDGLEPPQGWNVTGDRAKSCLPEGLALAAQAEHVGGGRDGIATAANDSSDEAAKGESAGAGSGGGGGMCAVSFASSSTSLASWFGLASLLALALRRRQRA